MNRFFGWIFSLALIIGSATVASAQDAPPPPPPNFGGGGQRMMFQFPAFAELDKNKDKKLSKDEVPPQFPPQMFDRVDTNHDGSNDEEEWKALAARMEEVAPTIMAGELPGPDFDGDQFECIVCEYGGTCPARQSFLAKPKTGTKRR